MNVEADIDVPESYVGWMMTAMKEWGCIPRSNKVVVSLSRGRKLIEIVQVEM